MPDSSDDDSSSSSSDPFSSHDSIKDPDYELLMSSTSTDEENIQQPVPAGSENDGEPFSVPHFDNEVLVTSTRDPADDISSTDGEHIIIQNQAARSEETEENNESTAMKKLTRKKPRCPEKWKQNKRKSAREAGQAYTNVKGMAHPARRVKSPCNCRLKCSTKITEEQRTLIHESFWQLTDDEKRFFYTNNVRKLLKKRTRTKNTSASPKKKFSFFYYLECGGQPINVCKMYFLKTLDISQRRINYHFSEIQQESGVPRPLKRGKHPKRVTKHEDYEKIENHIASFPTVESHYCRENTKKEYLESTLNITKMFELFQEAHPGTTVKSHTYRKVFNTQFNLSFHKPKKDRCDQCEEYKQLPEKTPAQEQAHQTHIKNKNSAKSERDNDRKNIDENTLVVCFDMENVFALPRADVSNFFYKSKFTSYNLTAHCNVNNTAYSALWHEMTGGRSANNIASALFQILKRILIDLPHVTDIILWSDSCVPQNRNHIMTTALKYFLRSHPTVKTLTHKFSEPGHGSVQEVDAIHSKIERFMKVQEVFSHLGLMKLMKKLASRKGQKMTNIMMLPQDFLDFQKVAKPFNYSKVPYTKIQFYHLKRDEEFNIEYGRNGHGGATTKISIIADMMKPRTARRTSNPNAVRPRAFPENVPQLSANIKLKPKKLKHIESMYKYMPPIDIAFYKAVLKK